MSQRELLRQSLRPSAHPKPTAAATASMCTMRYPMADIAEVDDDIREHILAVSEKTGFVPNVFLSLARRPDEFRAFFAYYDALMEKETGNLTKADREMIVTATSAANHCLYCVVAHGAVLRIYAKDPFVADQVAVDYAHADITDRQKAMLDFAMTVAQAPWTITEEDHAALAAHGFDAEDAWDIAAITGFFGLSNRMAHIAGMRPNPEFHLMGRTPREKRITEAAAAVDAAGSREPAETDAPAPTETARQPSESTAARPPATPTPKEANRR